MIAAPGSARAGLPAPPAGLDPWLGGLAAGLLAVGFVAIASASIEFAAAHHSSARHHSNRHLLHMGLALGAALLVYLPPPGFWRRAGWPCLLLALALLALVLIPGLGLKINGSQRWLALGPFSVQASEFASLLLVVYLAAHLARRGQALRDRWQGLVAPLLAVLAVAALLLAEPDFGAAAVTVGMACGMLFLGGARLGHLLLLALGSAALLVALLVAEPYRLRRLAAYVEPWADQFDSGYQLAQSQIAFGRGEWFGVGLGNSVQKLFYLPAAHTDFVFAIWAEETGLLGASLLMAMFLALILRVLWIARACARRGDPFGSHVCQGVGLILAAQVFINIGVAAGLLPTKGLTLPLVSYGGSSLVATCCMLAMVLRIDRERRRGGDASG